MTDWAQRRANWGEVIGGGWFVIARGDTTRRMVVDASNPPMEYATAEDAVRAAHKLANRFPGRTYAVLRQEVEIVINYSATTADTAAGGSGFSRTQDDAAAGSPSPMLAAATAETRGNNG